MELEKMKNETNAKFQKIETEYDAMRLVSLRRTNIEQKKLKKVYKDV